ncbi:TonB-dependent receptor plug domain-containing protein [Opitutus terrae]|uniref:TonB-dependent receptor plug n=1 Tax=Opitutus terrae (strain DSM 11246 / JCM 15787 / PB90-1) TaxID=452637 RepID=B1ZYE3_OPITP|nr:TonB-dependent receptor plug domain-containing protein [Opitutus terrae]ACB77041.1 TonB-dependent receptor plug [Opitutus terrae PB90-1]
MKTYPVPPSLRALVAATLLSTSGSLVAQSAPGTSPEVADDEPLVLSPFVVSSERDTGYQASSTLAGTRLRTELRDVGAAVSVVTSQFLADTQSTTAKDFLIYTTNTEAGGAGGNFSGVSSGNFSNPEGMFASPHQSTRVRGLAGADLTRDFFPTNIAMDSYNTERVDISRGANAILFGLGSPAGIINNQLKTADLRKPAYTVQNSVGRFDSHRELVDLNQPLVPGTLALRIIGLNDLRNYQQDPAYERDRRLFASVKFEPKWLKSGSTEFLVSYEMGDQDSNRPRVNPPQDGLTVWYSVLDKIALDPTAYTVPSEPLLAAHLAQPGRWYGQVAAVFTDPASSAQGGNGVPASMVNSVNTAGVPFGTWVATGAYTAMGNNPNFFLNRQYAPAGQAFSGLWKYQEISDPSIFDFYNHLLDGPNKWEGADFRAFNAVARQTFFHDRVGLELVYDEQNYDRRNFNTISYDAATLLVDMQTKLIDGSPNPNFGRPYVASDSVGNNLGHTARESYRATAFAVADFRQKENFLRYLGRHVFTGVYSDLDVYTLNRTYSGYGYERDLNAYANNSSVVTYPQYAAIHYLGSSIADLSSPAGAHIQPLTAVHTPQPTATALVFDARTNQWAHPTVTVLNSEHDIDKLYSNASKQSNRTKSYSAVWQAYLLKDLLVGTVGWREDEFALRDAGGAKTVAQTGQTNPFDPAWVLPDAPTIYAKDDTVSWSVVAHSPEFINRRLPAGMRVSLSYNESENFRPSATIADVYGRPFSPPSGSTKDYGVTFSFADNKFVLRVNRYETRQANDAATFYNTYWPGNDVVRAMNGLRSNVVNEHIINKWFGFQPGDSRYLPIRASLDNPAQANNPNPTLTAAEIAFRNEWFKQRTREEWLRPVDPLLASAWDFRQPTAGGNWTATRPPNVGNIADTVSRGMEFELTFNPLRNWRITANAAKQEAQKSNVGADFQEFIAANLPLWTDGDGVLAKNTRSMNGFEDIPYYSSFTGAMLGRDAINNMYVPYLNALAAEGSPVQEMRRWRFNLVTNYDFREGRLKGFAIGGAARWGDRIAIGFPVKQNEAGKWVYDVSHPYYGGEELNFDAWLRYGRRILNGKVGWSIQLNVRDLFTSNELIAISAQPSGMTASARIPQPNRWTLTNTFTF